MATQFAKLFDTPHGQLLAFLDETDEGDPCVTVIGAYHNGVRPSAKLSWPEEGGEEKAENAFAKIEQPQAETFAADLRSAVSGIGSAPSNA